MLENRSVVLNQEKQVFHLFFLKHNTNKDVEVVEVAEINFAEVMKRLEKGDSVFIAPKRAFKPKLESVFV
jgi:hypothetical protein